MGLNRNLIICFLSIALFSRVGWGVESGSSPESKGGALTRGSVWTPGEAMTSARSERGVLVLLRPNLRRVERQNLNRRFPEGFRYLISRSNPAVARRSSHVLRLSVMDRLIWTETPKGVSRSRFIQECRQFPEVESAEPDRRVSLAVDAEDKEPVHPDDFSFSKQWHLHNTGQTKGTEDADIDALEAWTLQTGNPQIQVAVIDTGIDYFHPDLEANIWLNSSEIPGNGIDDDGNGYIDDVHGYDFVSDDSDPMDDHQHGTHVSGIIGAKGDNEIGIAGVCWDVSLMAVKAFDDSGSTELSRVIEAIQYAVQNGAQIINASWGLDDSTTSDALEVLVREVRSLGILFVAAAGNADDDAPFFPASYPEVLSVGATDHKDKKASFSNFGEFVDLAAPGRNIFSTLPNADYGNLSGTSMAVPQVVGLAALIIASHPEFTPEDIANIMINRVGPVRSKQSVGSGRINAYEALRVEAPLPVADLELSDTLAGFLPISGEAG
ncbi:MAG TPA: hypothetical protein EYG38_17270, partial [Verrucomicrobia bacterium]|nr:hypothetical protein [Verrucomicrobiota bacterium]